MDPVKSILPNTRLETFSLTTPLLKQMAQWNHSEKYQLLMQTAARVVGFVGVVFTLIADILIHAALTLGKGLIALPILPLKICLRDLPRDLDLASPFVHLHVALNYGPKMIILPILIWLDLDKAYLTAQIGGDNNDITQRAERAKNLEKADQEYETKLKELEEVQQRQRESQIQLERLQKELRVAQDAAKPEKQEEIQKQVIKTLEEEIKELRAKYDAQSQMISAPQTEIQKQSDGTSLATQVESTSNRSLTPKEEVNENSPLDKESVRKNLMAEFVKVDQVDNANPPSKEDPKTPLKQPIARSTSLEDVNKAKDNPEVRKLCSSYAESSTYHSSGTTTGFINPRDLPHHASLMNEIAKGSSLRSSSFNFTRELAKKINEMTNKSSTFKLEYSRYVQAMYEYFDGLVQGSEPEIVYSEFESYKNEAKKEIDDIKNAAQKLKDDELKQLKEDKLKIYKTLWERLKSKNKQNSTSIDQSQQNIAVQREQKTEPVAAVEKTIENQKKKLKDFEFLNVENTAKQDLIEANKEIQKTLTGKNLVIKDFDDLLIKIQVFKDRIQNSSFDFNHLTEEFFLIVEVVKVLNQKYFCLNYNSLKVSNKDSALKALSFVDAKKEFKKYKFLVNNLIKTESENQISDISDFESLLKKIESGQISDQNTLNYCKKIVDRLNAGEYLSHVQQSVSSDRLKANSLKTTN